MELSNSPAKCAELPLPGVAKNICLGLAFAKLTNSCVVLAGTEGWVIKMSGKITILVTYAKSFSES